MKTKINFCKLVVVFLMFASTAFSQIIGVDPDGPGLIIRLNEAPYNRYMTISRVTGEVKIFKSLRFENTINPNIGVIYKGSNRFMHNFGIGNTFLGVNSGNFTMYGDASYNTGVGLSTLESNTTGYLNTAIGYGALQYNQDGADNTAIGSASLNSNISGIENTALGYGSLQYNTTGEKNTALGMGALYSNNGTFNTAVGHYSMYSNTTGSYNIGIGNSSLYYNVDGTENTALGINSMLANTSGSNNVAVGNGSLNASSTGNNNVAVGFLSMYSNNGSENTAVGFKSMYTNSTGNFNSAFGYGSLSDNTTGIENTAMGNYSLAYSTGSGNTAFGNNAGIDITTGSNNIVIGNNAQVPDGTADNQVQIGNYNVTYNGVSVAWTYTSDRRLKSNISNTNLGLNFISKLRPVSYTRNNDKKQKTEYGFIAQEVEDVLKESGVDNEGIVTIDDNGIYGIRYNDLLSPMVKAIQELKAENEDLKKEIVELKTVNEKVAKLEQIVNEMSSIQHTSLNTDKVNFTTSK